MSVYAIQEYREVFITDTRLVEFMGHLYLLCIGRLEVMRACNSALPWEHNNTQRCCPKQGDWWPQVKALRERNSVVKRKASIIINNMSKLVLNPADAAPFLPRLLPEVKKVRSLALTSPCQVIGACLVGQAAPSSPARCRR